MYNVDQSAQAQEFGCKMTECKNGGVAAGQLL